jgi:hypothetical protein
MQNMESRALSRKDFDPPQQQLHELPTEDMWEQILRNMLGCSTLATSTAPRDQH